MFGSTEGIGDLTVARRLNSVICKQADDDTWLLTYFHAAARAWWIIEYSGWYLDDVVPDSAIQGVDLDEGMYTPNFRYRYGAKSFARG